LWKLKIKIEDKISFYIPINNLPRNVSKKISIKITIIGAKSIPPNTVGINLLTRAYAGSVSLYSICTIGLYGSGLTQLRTAEIIITHLYKKMILSITVKIELNNASIIL
jgi:hypothetical protein